jgi:surface antigen
VDTSGRIAALTLSTLLTGGMSLTVGAAPASASITTLCSGYTGCAKAGMSDSGYSAASRTMYWRMYSGHNCTNYAAYRMVRAGLANSRPWTGGGNATYWGTNMATITNGTPTVGSVAWWKAGVKPAGSAGHVAYVERVVSANEIVLSQDSWNGDFSWTRVTRTGTGWPSGFIHFKDSRLLNTKAPAIAGTPKVGSTLTASPGTWNAAAATLTYQWLQNGVAIAGATTSTLAPKAGQQGKALTVRVTASSLGYPTTSATSAPTDAVAPGAIVSTTAPSISGEAKVGETLTANPGSWNPVPDGIRYQWRSAGAPVAGATGPALVLEPQVVGKPVSVAVTAVKAGYPAVTAVSDATSPVAPGFLTLDSAPTIVGTTQPGQVLQVVLPAPPAHSTTAVQWLRRGVPVPGATSSTYRLTTADLGSRVLAQVTVTRPGYATLTTRTVSSPTVRARPLIRVATAPTRGRLAVYADVTANGVRPVTGAIQIRSRGRLLRQVPLSNGVARATLTGLPRGTRTYRFVLPSTYRVEGGAVARRIRIG